MNKLTELGDNLVSWQSAFFAIVTVALSVLLQNAGAVLCNDQDLLRRICLRSSPVLCLLDTTFCVAKFMWILVLGCSPGAAVRHAWHDRFGNPESRAGSGIDLLWRFSMIAFVLGQMLQSVKIFACENIPLTQFLTAVYFIAFVVPEVFRALAGEAPEAEYASTPAVTQVKVRFELLQARGFLWGMVLQACIWNWVFSAALPSNWFIEDEWHLQGPNTKTASTYTMHLAITFLEMWFALFCFAVCVFLDLAIPAEFGKRFDVGVMEFYRSSAGKHNTSVEVTEVVGERAGGSMKETIIAKTHVLFVVLLVTLYTWLLNHDFWHLDQNLRYVPLARFLTAMILLPCLFTALYVLYLILLSGKILPYSRTILGLQGSFGEFGLTMCLIANFTTYMVYYSCLYDPAGTYKPAWTDNFG
jgi:hypothetical protein